MLVRDGVRVDEDSLTHGVFGLMRYLPSELWLAPFIHELRSMWHVDHELTTRLGPSRETRRPVVWDSPRQ